MLRPSGIVLTCHFVRSMLYIIVFLILLSENVINTYMFGGGGSLVHRGIYHSYDDP